MFDRFTERARKVMSYARQEAERLNHDYIGTEHILLGLCMVEPGLGIFILRLTAKPDEVKKEVLKRVQKGKKRVAFKQIPFTVPAKKVLEFAIDEADKLGNDCPDTEHLLLGLLREGDGTAAQVLVDAGLDIFSCRKEILKVDRSAVVEFSKWSPKAKDIFNGAIAIAKSLNSAQMELEHVLMALLDTKGSNALTILNELGCSVELVKRAVQSKLVKDMAKTLSDRLPFSLYTQSSLSFACTAANGWNKGYLGSEHILLGTMHATCIHSEPTPHLDLFVRMQDVRDLAKSFTKED
ncbi:MAG: hypothetical protein L6R28_18155 [Planctomycetes bacterium]|nr:hypothetical protein [Planctomycetota bacterium]